MKGKVKTLHGLYKKFGRDAFLAAATIYSENVYDTVEATLSAMEGTWYDTKCTITEADKMIADYNRGHLTKESAEALLQQMQLSEAFDQRMDAILKNVDLKQLDESLNSDDKSYAVDVLKQMHTAFVKTYGTDYLTDEYEFVNIPAVIRARGSGKLCLGIVTLDLQSSGEHWETVFLTPHGAIRQGDFDADASMQEYIRSNFIPYDYLYTADVEDDIHIQFERCHEDMSEIIDAVRDETQDEELDYGMKL